MRGCIECGDVLSSESEIEESVQRSEELALAHDNLDILERAFVRAELERAGLCTYHAVLKRDDARDGQKGAN